ncbi:MAG: DUF4347 domain-containing protein [Bacteroidia bacterium]|nr:DUF4347 domain-containing protein [Bacteroidia bacterium]MDW8158290.1 DUF4347 domain-containing protein [Bacteroidia bacterium]
MNLKKKIVMLLLSVILLSDVVHVEGKSLNYFYGHNHFYGYGQDMSEVNYPDEGMKIVVISQDIEDLATILEHLSSDAQIVFFDPLLDTPEEVIEKIVTISKLENREISILAFLGQGQEQGMWIGNQLIHLYNLSNFTAAFTSLKQVLAEGAYLYFYGSYFQDAEEGGTFLNTLAQLLDAKVYTSVNITGRDGDWVLEIGSHPEAYAEILDSEALSTAYYYNL